MNNNDILDIYENDDNTNDEFYKYIEIKKKENDEIFAKTGRRPKWLTVTHGCQMNEHDSEKIGWILEEMHYEKTEDVAEADFVLYNTCMIRENAELKLFGQVGSLKQIKMEKPELIIAISGCMMQVEGPRKEILEKYRHVDIIFGTNNIHRLPLLMNKLKDTNKTVVDIIEDDYDIVENIEANRLFNFKAYVNIMFGCNNFCTYCIVPYARGREKSREPEDIIKEIEALAKNGYKEITLLGQNVNSYGKTLTTHEKYSFTDLLKEINNIEGLERIRFMTSHPRDISDELINAFGELDKVSKYIHLPVQSGSNNVLKRMNRHYTREKYLDIVAKLKNTVPDIAIGTDIIVGFPGETEEDFNDTIEMVKEVEYDNAFTFLYSVREGTKAAVMEDQIDEKIKHERFDRLLEILYPIFQKKNEEYIGETVEVLVESLSKNDENTLTGRTDTFKLVHFPGDSELIGKIVKVKINEVTSFTLTGDLI